MGTMELSLETPTKNQSTSTSKEEVDKINAPSTSCQIFEKNELIDCSKLNLSDNENWLFKCSNSSGTDAEKWLYSGDEYSDDLLPSNLTGKITKNIDMQTFARIEKYNEELYGNELNSELTDSEIQLNGDLQEEPTNLNQPAFNSFYFENMLETESFQDMSPPSLVNGVLENSFIKNGPVLREIRDTDHTGLNLQQESEPLYQSITGSWSSLNSDTPENLLKKISLNERNLIHTLDSEEIEGIVINSTFAKDTSSDGTSDDLDVAIICEDLNGTFSKEEISCSMAPDVNNATIKLNNTYQRRKKIGAVNNQTITRHDLKSTITLEAKRRDEKPPVENIKRLLDRRPSPLDLNRIDQLNSIFTSENIMRNSVGSSDAMENLDYMSLSSGSNKSSNKILSMNGINIIANIPERSVHLTSTPNSKTIVAMWPNDLSPISGRNSDPELSSSEKTDVKPSPPTNPIKKQKSTGRMPPPRSVNHMTNVKNSIRSSQPNLKMTKPRSYHVKNPQVAQVSPTLQGSEPNCENAQFVRSRCQPQRTSALPRPITGIPRAVSRIPGPRGVK